MATESKVPETDIRFKTREAEFDYHVSRVIRSQDMHLEHQIHRFQNILDSFPEIYPNRYLYGDITPFLLACNVKAYPLAAYIYKFLTPAEITMRNNSGSSIEESACVREISTNMTQEQRPVVIRLVTEERDKRASIERAAAEEEQRRADEARAAAEEEQRRADEEHAAAERAEESRIRKEQRRAEKQRRAQRRVDEVALLISDRERAVREVPEHALYFHQANHARELVGGDGSEIERRAAEIAGFEDVETTDARARAMISNLKAIKKGRRRKSRKRSTSRKSHTSL